MNAPHTLTISLEVSITQDDLRSILIAILDNPAPWWDLVVTYDWMKSLTIPKAMQAANHILNGNSISLNVKDKDEKFSLYDLTQTSVLNGIRKHLEEGSFLTIRDNQWDISTISEMEADCILQWALFDEQLYE